MSFVFLLSCLPHLVYRFLTSNLVIEGTLNQEMDQGKLRVLSGAWVGGCGREAHIHVVDSQQSVRVESVPKFLPPLAEYSRLLLHYNYHIVGSCVFTLRAL